MPAAWHQIWGSQIVTFRGFRWRVGIGRIDAATARALGSAPRGLHRTKPRHPKVCAWLDLAALMGGPPPPPGAESGSFTDTLTY